MIAFLSIFKKNMLVYKTRNNERDIAITALRGSNVHVRVGYCISDLDFYSVLYCKRLINQSIISLTLNVSVLNSHGGVVWVNVRSVSGQHLVWRHGGIGIHFSISFSFRRTQILIETVSAFSSLGNVWTSWWEIWMIVSVASDSWTSLCVFLVILICVWVQILLYLCEKNMVKEFLNWTLILI